MTIHIIPRLSVGAGVECSPVESIPTLRVHAQSSSESPPVWRSRQRDEDSRSTLPRTPRWPRSDPARRQTPPAAPHSASVRETRARLNSANWNWWEYSAVQSALGVSATSVLPEFCGCRSCPAPDAIPNPRETLGLGGARTREILDAGADSGTAQ